MVYNVIERRYEVSIYNYGGVLDYDTTCMDDFIIGEFNNFNAAFEELAKYNNEFEEADGKYDVVEYLISYTDENEYIQEYSLDGTILSQCEKAYCEKHSK